jgi:hypothetical protein
MSIESSHRSSVNRQPAAGVLSRAKRASALVLASAAALTVTVLPLEAQSSGKGFLFNNPVGSFTLRGGYALANAGSDVFADATNQLTLDKRDFSSFSWGGDFAYSAGPRLDILVDGSFSKTTKDSEVRDFVEDLPNGGSAPIKQVTGYRRVPLTLGIRYYLADRGRSVGQFAYIPTKFAPYVGIGAGAMWYRFKQNGDFVDFATDPQFPEIFSAELESSGWTPMAHGAAGIDYTIGPWLALTGEARYQWARARLDPEVFVNYDKIDLSGVTGTVGFKVRF